MSTIDNGASSQNDIDALYKTLLDEREQPVWRAAASQLAVLQQLDFRRFHVLKEAAYTKAGITGKDFDRMVESASQKNASQKNEILWQRANELQHEVIAPLRWCIDELITEGLIVLAGRPKKGKSMLALNLGIAKATGGIALGRYKTIEAGDVAYLALEDGKRRVKYRIEQLMAPGETWPERLWLAYQSPRLNEGLTARLTEWAKKAESPSLVIVDILARVTPRAPIKGSPYDAEYQVMAELMDWASSRQLALIVVTHSTKAKAEDVFETVMNTTANTGASATNMVLVRNTGEDIAFLHIQGKDVPMMELALNTVDGFTWQYAGEAQDVKMTAERREMLEALYNSDGQACTRKQLADMLGTNTNALNQRIRAAQEKGYVILRDGKVALTDKGAILIAEALAQGKDVSL